MEGQCYTQDIREDREEDESSVETSWQTIVAEPAPLSKSERTSSPSPSEATRDVVISERDRTSAPAERDEKLDKLMQLRSRTEKDLELLMELHKIDPEQFPIDLPVGATLRVKDSDGRLIEMRADTLKRSPHLQRLLENSTFTDVRWSEFRTGLDMHGRHNVFAASLELSLWQKRNEPRMQQAASELIRLTRNPQSLLQYGEDYCKQGTLAILDPKGSFLGLTEQDTYTGRKGESLVSVNRIAYDFTVCEITEGENKGKLVISQSAKVQNAPWYAYNDIEALGIQTVAKARIPDRTVDPDQLIAVEKQGKISFMEARELQRFHQWQAFKYAIHKTLHVDPMPAGSGGLVPVMLRRWTKP